MGCEADGVKLENCASYVREWMEREEGLKAGFFRLDSCDFVDRSDLSAKQNDPRNHTKHHE
ncbi:MAG: hypothetical protein QOH71_3345 [Blastocatellia bacterium]|jgi:hypothetical protein|nr:hypothetical protein [Blastocatellia bacterium]